MYIIKFHDKEQFNNILYFGMLVKFPLIKSTEEKKIKLNFFSKFHHEIKLTVNCNCTTGNVIIYSPCAL